MSSPNTRVIFSEIVPRLLWLRNPNFKNLEKLRRRINKSMEKCMPVIGGFSYRHLDVEGGFSGLYRSDSVQLSEVGLDIFNLGLHSSIDSAGVGEDASPVVGDWYL